MNHIISSLELYGSKPSFTINGRSQYSTLLDHIVSALTIIIIALFTLFFSLELFKRNRPMITTTVLNEFNPERINLNSSEFILALGLQDRNYKNYIDESIYTVGLKLQSIFKTSDGTKIETKEIEITTCDNVYMPVLTNFFQKLDLSNLYCLKNNSELYIRGTNSVSQWTYLEFVYRKCNNDTLIAEGKKQICSEESVIKDTLDQSYFSFFMTDYSLMPKEYKNPKVLLGKIFLLV